MKLTESIHNSTSPMTGFINIAAYKFVELDNLDKRKSELLPLCKSLDLKGSVLLSTEGINVFVAGRRENIDALLEHLRGQIEFADLQVKESVSVDQPFSRMLVRLKKEIISMGVQEIQPLKNTSPKISAHELKKWLDEGRDVALLDVRNDYEVELGTFVGAIPIGVDHFRKFPEATETLPADLKDKPVVMFCTGGIRCEKAGPLMEQQGFNQIFQLDGGILKYFEECGGEHYQGDCFVFDKRVAVDPGLNETDAEQCFACQSILSAAEQQSSQYDPPNSCPHCFQTVEQKMAALLAARELQLKELTTPLPGCVPYDNVRPMNVPLEFDHRPLIDFLSAMNARLDREFWIKECEAGRVTYKHQPQSAETIARAGWRVHHLIPQTTEPEVSNDVRFLYEDESIFAIDKPAPLPMHACGRFNRNSLQYFMQLVYAGEQVRILHRLDLETAGVVLMARKQSAAAFVQKQFADGKIEKTYLARVIGHPESDRFSCDAAISSQPMDKRGLRVIDPTGLPSVTEFEVINRDADATAVLKCYPKTGRTNQIRIHLQHLGFPIVGDNDYSAKQSTPKKWADRGLCLHAFALTLTLPNGQRRTIQSVTSDRITDG